MVVVKNSSDKIVHCSSIRLINATFLYGFLEQIVLDWTSTIFKSFFKVQQNTIALLLRFHNFTQFTKCLLFR